MSENEFLNALKEEMPESFGRELLAQLKAEEAKKVKPFPTFWTVAVASIVTVLVGLVLFMSRNASETPLSMARELWQMRETITPQNISQLQPLLTIGHGQAEVIALSPDNNTLAVGTSIGIYLHDAHNLDAAPRFLGLPEDAEMEEVVAYRRFAYLDYTPDGRLFTMMVKSQEITLYEWDETTQSFLSLYTLGSPWRVAQVIQVSPDGTKLLLGTCSMQNGMYGDFCHNEGQVRLQIVDLLNGGNVFSYMPRRIANAVADISPDWTQLVYEEDNQIKLYDLESEDTQTLVTIEVPPQTDYVMPWAQMHQIYFSPDGTKIGVVDNSSSPMDWWSLAELQQEAITVPVFGQEFNGFVNNVASRAGLHPHEDSYVIGSSIGLFVYDYGETNSRARFSSQTQPRYLIPSSDGQWLYTLDASGMIRKWQWDNQSLETTNMRYTTATSFHYTISADSRLFANSDYGDSEMGYLYEITDSGIEATLLSASTYNSSLYTNVAISQDGRYVAFAENGTLWVYNRHEESRTLLSNNVNSRALGFNAEGDLLSFHTSSGAVESIVEVYTAEMLEETAAMGDVGVQNLEIPVPLNREYTADGSTMLFLSCENMAEYPYYYMDGQRLPCVDMNVSLFDTSKWEIIQNLDTGRGDHLYLSNFTMSTDSNWLMISFCQQSMPDGWNCVENSYVLEFWHLPSIQENPAPVMRLENLPEVFSGIGQIVPYADGSFLIAAYGYNPATIGYLPYTTFFELEADGEYRELLRIPAHGVSIAPDRSYLLSSKDGQITLWGVPASVASSN